MADAMKATVAAMLQGIDRYNPENLNTLEKYVEIQARENAYDLEANLAVLKLYQFNAQELKKSIVQLILLKALTNLPHTDFVLCKCLIDQQLLESEDISNIVGLHDLLETCQFKQFWTIMRDKEVLVNKIVAGITGFEDSIRKFICHVVNITYQHIEKETLFAFLGNLQVFFDVRCTQPGCSMNYDAKPCPTCERLAKLCLACREHERAKTSFDVQCTPPKCEQLGCANNLDNKKPGPTCDRARTSVDVQFPTPICEQLGCDNYFDKKPCPTCDRARNLKLRNWMNKYGWKETENRLIFIGNQEENIKTKNINEKIDFESVAAIMSLTR